MRYVILNESWKVKSFDEYDSYYIIKCNKKFVFIPSDIIEADCSYITIDRSEGTYKLHNVPLELQNDENFKEELNNFLEIDLNLKLEPEESTYYKKKRMQFGGKITK